MEIFASGSDEYVRQKSRPPQCGREIEEKKVGMRISNGNFFSSHLAVKEDFLPILYVRVKQSVFQGLTTVFSFQ